MNTSATNRRLRLLLTAISKESLIPQPDFQRRLVWSNKDKVEFIKTVLEGYPFPEIYIAAGSVDPKTGEGSELLVDGQQRITTLYQYFRNADDLKLPHNVKAYSDLEESKQIEFLEYEVVIRDLGNKPIDEIKEIFQRINSTSYGLNAMEIHNARYGGEFKAFAEEMSEHKIFEDSRFFTSVDIKRMNDTRYCLGLISTIISNYFNMDKEIEGFLKRYNESFEDRKKYQKEVNETFQVITSLNFPASTRLFKKADFFTIFVELHRAKFKLQKKINIVDIRKNLENFYNEVDRVTSQGTTDIAEKYYRAALQGSNNRSNRVIRGDIIQKII